MAAAHVGARPITAVDAQRAKLDLARRADATHAIGPDEVSAVPGADHVLEAVGLTRTAELAMELARPGGTITLVGMIPQGERAGIDAYRFVEEGKVIRGSNYGSTTPARDFPRIAALYAEGRLPLDLLVTERIRLEEIPRALDAMRIGDGARRVVVY